MFSIVDPKSPVKELRPRLVASGDGFMCDTGRPGDAVALQYHLNGIVQGGLNAEFLALGDTDEHLMIRSSYEPP